MNYLPNLDFCCGPVVSSMNMSFNPLLSTIRRSLDRMARSSEEYSLRVSRHMLGTPCPSISSIFVFVVSFVNPCCNPFCSMSLFLACL